MRIIFATILAILFTGFVPAQDASDSPYGPALPQRSSSANAPVARPYPSRIRKMPSFHRAYPEKSWYPMTGIPGAMVNALAVAPSNTAVMYAGTWGSGVYRTNDAGLNWEHYRPGSAGLVQFLAVNPRDPETALALFASSGLYPNKGVLRTTDGGRTWLPVVEEGRFERIYSIEIHQFRPDTLYADGMDTSYYSAFISTDNGMTWSTISGLYGFDRLDFVPGHPDSVLAIDYNRLYSSSDGGFSFSWIEFAEYYGRLEDLQIDPLHPGVVYIAAAEGLLKTSDGCQTWEIIQTPFGYDPTDSLSNPPGLEQVVLNTHDTNQLLVSNSESLVYESSDGGETWSSRESSPHFPYISRIYEILFSPTDTSYLIGTWWQGMLRLTSEGWSTANAGLDNQFVSGIEVVAKDTLYMSTLGNGFFATTDGGRTWEQRVSGLDSWHIRQIVSHPTDPEILFAATYDHGFFRTVDGGSAWIKVAGAPGEDGLSFCISPSDPDSMFAIGQSTTTNTSALYRSKDGGQNWERIFAQDTSLHSITVDPTDGRHVLLSAGYFSVESGYRYIYKLVESTDGGDTWDWEGADSTVASVRDFVFLPGDHELLITIWDEGVLARNEGGEWISRDTTGLPAGAYLTFMTLGPNQELVAGAWGGGVYRSWDRGYTWIADTLGLISSGPLAYSCAIVGADTVQILGTYDGPYSYGLNDLGTERDLRGLPLKVTLHSNYPNPFNPTTTLVFELSRETVAQLVIYDIRGRVVAEMVDGHQAAGTHHVAWNGRNRQGRELSSGVYFARLVTPEYSKSIKMLLLK